VPITFSYRLNESSFSEDLQNFALLHLAVRDQKFTREVQPVEKFEKYGKEHPIYYDFELRTYQRPPFLYNNASKFYNARAHNIWAKDFPTLFAGKQLWILKPSDLSRGRGLELFNTLEQLHHFLLMYTKEGYCAPDYSVLGYSDDNKHSHWVEFNKEGTDSTNSQSTAAAKKAARANFSSLTFQSFVIQKYIEKPLLYKGYKFDIRVLVLYTTNCELFIFPESYIRLSSYEYSPDNLNYYVHLTNNAVQCNSRNYGSLCDGNIFGMTDFEKHIKAEEKAKHAERQQNQTGSQEPIEDSSAKFDGTYFMSEIKKAVEICFDAGHALINPNHRVNIFELFGFDFMIDENYKVWLIECNNVPSLSESNLFLTNLFRRLIGRTGLT
jgi:tubulin---tyrosine ligase